MKVAEFSVDCGGGTYIRSLSRDIAHKCGSLGTMTALKRTYSGPFTCENAVGIETVKQEALKYLIPVTQVLAGIYESEELNERDIKAFTNGVPVRTNRADGDVLVTIGGREYAIARCNGGKMKANINLW